MIVAWTGHRPEVFDDPRAARLTVEQHASAMRPTATQFVVGGQRGVDTWAALAAITLGLPVVFILPHAPELFTAGWSAADRAALDETLAQAASVQIADGYSERNRRLVDAADLLVAVWTGTRGGGTEETIALARAANVPLRELVLPPADGAEFLRGRGI